MRIWVLNHNLREEGTWHRAWPLACQLQKHGHEVTIFTVHPRRRLTARCQETQGVRVVETPYMGPQRWAASGLDAWDLCWRWNHIKRGTWDLLYMFSSLPNVSLPFLAARQAYPRRYFLADWDDLFSDGGIYAYLDRGVTRPLYRWERHLEFHSRAVAHGVTVTSRYLQEKASSIRQDGRIAYLPTGANVAEIPVVEKLAARRKLGLTGQRVIVTFLGGGFNEDGLLLLRAFAQARRANDNLFLLFVGNRDTRYLNLIEQIGLKDAVLMAGRIPFAEVPWYLGAADLLAMPLHDSVNSRARGPIKLRDYLCAGRPIVGTALGEVAEWLQRFPVGLLAGAESASFAEQLLKLAGDEALRCRMGQAARRVAEQELSWTVIGQTLETQIRAWFK